MQLNEMNQDDQIKKLLSWKSNEEVIPPESPYWAHERAIKSLKANFKPTHDAEEFYQEVVVASAVFEEACKLHPNYNSDPTACAEWIMNQIEDGLFDQGRDPYWQSIKDDVHEKIIAGLT